MATPRFVSGLDTSIFQLVGDLRCFDKMQWEGVLSLRD